MKENRVQHIVFETRVRSEAMQLERVAAFSIVCLLLGGVLQPDSDGAFTTYLKPGDYLLASMGKFACSRIRDFVIRAMFVVSDKK